MVEIHFVQGAVILRERHAELLILPRYIETLQTLKQAQAFGDYFTKEALVNRPARKLFLAWVRKDPTLWNRLYSTVHKNAQKSDVQTPDTQNVIEST